MCQGWMRIFGVLKEYFCPKRFRKNQVNIFCCEEKFCPNLSIIQVSSNHQQIFTTIAVITNESGMSSPLNRRLTPIYLTIIKENLIKVSLSEVFQYTCLPRAITFFKTWPMLEIYFILLNNLNIEFSFSNEKLLQSTHITTNMTIAGSRHKLK